MKDTAALEGSSIDAGTDSQTGKPDWIALARSAYERSTDFLDVNYRKTWEHSLANYRGVHPPGSKYYSEAYKHRSKLFRPKTRTFVAKNEAAFAAAMFSTEDVVEVTPHDKSNQAAVDSSEFWKQVLNYRLTRTIPWFKVAVGAFQEAHVYGGVVSKQEWDYRIRVVGEEVVKDPYGKPMVDEATQEPIIQPRTIVDKNEPKIKLIEIENIRIDPAADWLDPINSSPYVIELVPMYIGDILDYMNTWDPETGEYMWKRYSEGEIEASRNSIKTEHQLQRESQTKDKRDLNQDVSEFNTAWVLCNFVRYRGKEYVYHTLGTDKLLSDPEPLEKNHPQGRPYVLGVANIEAHKVYPSGPVELAKDLQAAANDTQNQRRDNVQQVLNKRYIALRNKNTDFAALKRNVPGGVVLTDAASAKEAVHMIETPDVTASAYLEQDRVNVDFDDLTGTMSAGTVQSNRNLNETVGGLNLLSTSANVATEYTAKTFVITWAELALNQLLKLEMAYETDEVLHLFLKEGEAVPTETAMEAQVNVGFGNTDPLRKVSRLLFALESLAKIAPWLVAKAKMGRIAAEIFGAVGYRDGSRFFDDIDNIQPPEAQQDPMIEVKMAEIQTKTELEQMRLANELEIAYAKMASTEGITLRELEQRLGIEMENIKMKRDVEGVRALNAQNELAFKATTGRQGI